MDGVARMAWERRRGKDITGRLAGSRRGKDGAEGRHRRDAKSRPAGGGAEGAAREGRCGEACCAGTGNHAEGWHEGQRGRDGAGRPETTRPRHFRCARRTLDKYACASCSKLAMHGA